MSLNSLKNLRTGASAGENSRVRHALENGTASSLHFQSCDMQGWKGDYPVSAGIRKGSMLDNCPDPDLILGMVRLALRFNPPQ